MLTTFTSLIKPPNIPFHTREPTGAQCFVPLIKALLIKLVIRTWFCVLLGLLISTQSHACTYVRYLVSKYSHAWTYGRGVSFQNILINSCMVMGRSGKYAGPLGYTRLEPEWSGCQSILTRSCHAVPDRTQDGTDFYFYFLKGCLQIKIHRAPSGYKSIR